MQGSQDPMAAPWFPAKPHFPEGTLESLGFPCLPEESPDLAPRPCPCQWGGGVGWGCSPGCQTGPPSALPTSPGAFPAPRLPPYNSV